MMYEITNIALHPTYTLPKQNHWRSLSFHRFHHLVNKKQSQSGLYERKGLNPEENSDNASILLKYENGSTGLINYFSNGSKAYSKERIEVYSQERTLIMDNFRVTNGYGFKDFYKLKTALDIGHKNQFQKLISQSKSGGNALITFDEIVNTTQASFAAIESLQKGKWIEL